MTDAVHGMQGLAGSDKGLISLTEATRIMPRLDGKKVSTCAVWRWARRGLRGVKLDYCRVGRRICVTHQALRQFFTRLTELDRQVPADRRCQPRLFKRLSKRRPITSKERLRSLAEADRVLKRARI